MCLYYQLANFFKELAINVIEGCEFLAVDIEHSNDIASLGEHRNDNL